MYHVHHALILPEFVQGWRFLQLRVRDEDAALQLIFEDAFRQYQCSVHSGIPGIP